VNTFSRTDFGRRLCAARRAVGYSKRMAARLCEVDHTYLSHLEAGRRTPSVKMVLVLADLLHVSVDFLLGRVAAMQHLSDRGGEVAVVAKGTLP
jgi:transcriptional regulator with XRE-family HTH domain